LQKNIQHDFHHQQNTSIAKIFKSTGNNGLSLTGVQFYQYVLQIWCNIYLLCSCLL